MSERHRGQEGDTQDERPVLRASPEPTEEELAAITAAVVALSRTLTPGAEEEAAPEDRWRRTGRRETLRSPLVRSVHWK